MHIIHKVDTRYQYSKLAAPDSSLYIYENTPIYHPELTMINAPTQVNHAAAPSHSLLSLVVAFLTLNLREKLEPGYTGQDSDPAYYGCGL